MSEVQRLESLLSTVQQNRQKPRAGGAPAVLKIAATAPDAEISFADAAPSLPPAPRPSEPKPKLTRSKVARPTPIERAFEGELSAQAAAPSHATATSVDVAAVAARGGIAREPLNVPAPPQPSKPIAQAASSAPSMEEVSFGELLRRSLSLRPR